MLCVALLGAVVAGFVIGMPVPKALFAVLIVVLGMLLAGYAVVKLRPGTTGVLAAPIVVLVVAALSGTGGHSLWLTMFGDETSCEVTGVNTHVGRRSPTTYSNSLTCGSRHVDVHTPADGHVDQPGERTGLVLDRFGVLLPLEPAEVAWWRNVLVPTAAVTGAVFVLFVLRRPRWEPRTPVQQRKPQLGKDFL
jgi:hypothetical protein